MAVAVAMCVGLRLCVGRAAAVAGGSSSNLLCRGGPFKCPAPQLVGPMKAAYSPQATQQQLCRPAAAGSAGAHRSTGPARGLAVAAAAAKAGGEGGGSGSGRHGSGLSAAWSLLAAAGRALLALLLLAAAAPYVLSSAWGTRACSRAASRVLPGEVRIERLRLGWTRPLTVEGLSVHEGAAGSSRLLVSLERLSSAEPLHRVLLQRGGGLTLTLTRPVVDATLDDTGEALRVAKFAGEARLLGLLSRPAWARADGGAAGGGGGGAAGGGGGAAAAAGECGAAAPSEAAPGAPEAAKDVRSHPILSTAESLESAEAADAPPLSELRRRLTLADAAARLSAELRLPGVSVYAPDGTLLLPGEVRAAIGEHIHAVAAAGEQQVLELADELGEDSGWIDKQQQQQQQQPAAEGAAASWAIPPAGVGVRAWRAAPPVLLSVSGERVRGQLRGWRVGRRALLLQQPARASWHFTPEFARLTLGQFNPLLQDALALEQGGRVETQYSPQAGLLPASSGKVWVSPTQLVVGEGRLLRQVRQLLDAAQGSAGAAGGRRPRQQRAAHQRQQRGVAAWSGPLTVNVEAPGLYRVDRADVLIGADGGRAAEGGAGQLHVVLWGRVDTNSDTLDMRIGLPAATLARAGLSAVPGGPAFVLPLSVSGALAAPHIDLPAALRKLAVLAAMQASRGAWQRDAPPPPPPQQQQQQQQLGQQQQPRGEETGRPPGGLAGLVPGLMGRAVAGAAGSFFGQMDERLQQELLEAAPPPAGGLPWAAAPEAGERRPGPPASLARPEGGAAGPPRQG